MRRVIACASVLAIGGLIACGSLETPAALSETLAPEEGRQISPVPETLAPAGETMAAVPEISGAADGSPWQTEIPEEEMDMIISVKSSEYEIIYALNDSAAARHLYEQLPLTAEAEPFSDNEITFYPPEKLRIGDTPYGSGESGTLAYYAPWGDVVLFYAPCAPNSSLYELGTAISGGENVGKLAGTLTVSAEDGNQD